MSDTDNLNTTPLPNKQDPIQNAVHSPWSQTWSIVSARLKALSHKAAKRINQRTLIIGVSARIFHPEPGAIGLSSRTLQYLEESIAQWVMSRDVMVLMIPSVNNNSLLHNSSIRLRDYAKQLDGLVLQGGADVAPMSYAKAATRPEWNGDRARDMYELELLHEFIEAGKPVLGICRGCQLINVAFGGTLYQDIASDVPHAIAHVSEKYDGNTHSIRMTEGGLLAGLFDSKPVALVNSIHHQAVNTLGRDIIVEATSTDDLIIEAIRYSKSNFVVGLQWHPEFHRAGSAELLDCTAILDSFLRTARETRF
ncbi:MAG: type 1 glutamine amidotransferase [bacterium]